MGLFRRSKPVEEPVEEPEVDEPRTGPFDSAEGSAEGLLDCGSLLLAPVEGLEVQFTVERQRDMVLGVVYVGPTSAVQLQVFAAPKSAGIWDDVRADMISSIAGQGGTSTEAVGEFGKEIRAHMLVGDGQRQAVTYVGIDGPRWLLRATVTGHGASNKVEGDRLLHAVLDRLVVVRGQEPHPPREILPLRIPKAPAQQGDEPERPTLELPGRGPEIAEVR